MSQATSRRALWLQKIADQVAHALSDRIASGALAPGVSPGSRDALAAEFVTSPSVIDRALEQMTDQGLLVPGPDGSHAVSATPVRDHGFELPQQETLSDVIAIMELRLGLEAVGAAFAAERHDAAQLAEIRAAAEAYESANLAGTGLGQADFRFHHAIAAASGNSYLLDLLDYLGPLLIPRLRVTLGPVQGAAEPSVAEHQAIVGAIATRDADGARRAMRAHLLRTTERVKTLAAG